MAECQQSRRSLWPITKSDLEVALVDKLKTLSDRPDNGYEYVVLCARPLFEEVGAPTALGCE